MLFLFDSKGFREGSSQQNYDSM